MDGAVSAPAGNRLLRHALFVAGIAAAGWLLSMLFAAGASADPTFEPPGNPPTKGSVALPAAEPEPQAEAEQAPAPVPVEEPAPADDTAATGYQHSTGGLLGGLVSGLTSTVNGLTETLTNITSTVLDTTTSLLPMPDAPDDDSLIGLLPAPDDVTSPAPDGIGIGTGVARSDVIAAPTAPATPPVQPARRQAAVATAPEQHSWRQLLINTQAAQATTSSNAEHARNSGDDQQPPRAPSAPAGPGSTVSTAHDTSGGARGTHGVLSTLATPMPADAGYTTRSRATDATGRDAGLPAASPD